MLSVLSVLSDGMSMPGMVHLERRCLYMSREFASAFYHSPEWAKVRTYVLMRDRYTCTRCNKPAQEVHHIIRLTPDNIWDVKVTLNPDNLVSLCRDCHFAEHKAEKEAAWRKANGEKQKQCAEGFHFDENGMLIPDAPKIF